MTITSDQYFGKPHSFAQEASAKALLEIVNKLLLESGLPTPLDDTTGSQISGAKGGDGDGGFRTPASQTGAIHSAHRSAEAVDIHDPDNALDGWLDTFEDGQGGNVKLAEYGLYREAPETTPRWTHLTTRAPASGKRTFQP